MLASVVLAAVVAAPLGVWPQETGPAAVDVGGIEFYVLEPEDEYGILAVQSLAAPFRKADAAAVRRLAGVARKLGADAVILLGEMPESAIPPSVETPLPTTARYSMAVYISYSDSGTEQEGAPGRVARLRGRRGHATLARHSSRAAGRLAPH